MNKEQKERCLEKQDLSSKWIIENLNYDKNSGLISIKGKILYSKTNEGYLRIRVPKEIGNFYIAQHRVAWFLFYGKWPDKCIDHINGDRSDNRIDNLIPRK